MRVNIKATGIKLTPALTDFIERKIGSLDKFISHDGGVQVWAEVGVTTQHHKSGKIFRAEIQIPLPHIKDGLRVETTNIDLYTAVEDARDEIKNELQKIKEKKISLTRRGARIFKNLTKLIPFLRK
ncbi:MAG: ribosome-associated translation inhibitor RaiA [Patescibacteria group bacterium]